MKKHFEGEFAYIDSVRSGLVPCRVISVEQFYVRVKVTANRGGFQRGEEFVGTASQIVPRSHVHHRRMGAVINPNYEWAMISGSRVSFNWDDLYDHKADWE